MPTEKHPIPYKVRDKVTGDVFYASAKSRNQARSFASHNRFAVEPLSVREALTINPADVFDATGELHPDQAPLDLRPAISPCATGTTCDVRELTNT